MKLVTRGDKNFAVVFDPANEVTDFRRQVRPHLLGMYWRLEQLGGISLAAQQVGIPLKFFIWRDHQNGTKFFSVVINPRVDFRSSQIERMKEADLCDPNRIVTIERPIGIKVTYTDAAGEEHSQRFFTGLHAQVFLHEIERQNGVSPFRRALEPATA